MNTTRTLENRVTVTQSTGPRRPDDPTGDNWIRISVTGATPKQREDIEDVAAELRAEDPGRTVVVDLS